MTDLAKVEVQTRSVYHSEQGVYDTEQSCGTTTFRINYSQHQE